MSVSKVIPTSLSISSIDVWYSIVISQDNKLRVKIYGGEKDDELVRVAEYNDAKIFALDSSSVAMSSIVFGTTAYPSAGKLQNGKVSNIRFWARSLTDRECECVDTMQDNLIVDTV